MFVGEFHAHADATGQFRLPPIFLGAFPPPEEAGGRQVVFLKSLDRSLWLYRAQGWEAKLETTRQELDDEQSRLLMHYVMAESTLGRSMPEDDFSSPRLVMSFGRTKFARPSSFPSTEQIGPDGCTGAV